MKLPEKIDMHMHSNISDGTDAPEEILPLVKEKGIGMFSVTDHDAFKGAHAIRKIRTPDDPVFVPGVEFSCRDELGKYHILGYGYDPDTDPIRILVETGHSYRMKKVLGRIQFLKEQFGMSFPEQEIQELFHLSNPGKPHIALMMVRHGFAETKEKAIHDFLNKAHIKSGYIRPEEAIQGILGSGGVPVLAHPSYGSGDEIIVGGEMEERVRRLTGFGLQGLEAYYSGFTGLLIGENLALAEKFGLLVTAGSDYHGQNKLVHIGETNLGSVSEAADGLKRFVELMMDRCA